jgi:hypothetical protein
MKAGKISRIVVNEPMERVSDGHVVSATASAQVT